MKIGIFDPYLDTLGGGEKYMLSVALCLSEKHTVSIFWDTDRNSIKENAKKRFNFDLDKITFAPNIFSTQTPLLHRGIEAHKYDVIVFLSDGAIPLLFKKNLIIHFQFPVEWVKQSLLTRIKFLCVKNVICNSLFTKAHIDKTFGIVSNVVYPPVGLPKKEYKKENIILNVGRFSVGKEGKNYKKQDILIDFFKDMVKKYPVPSWKFVLIISVLDVDKGKIEILRGIAKGYPVEIIENPTFAKLWEMYGVAKIYWHASGFGEDLEKNPERAEHFGIATAEAMGAGAVPVVINAGGQKEIVENKKSGFLWSTKKELLTQTIELIQNSALLEKMSKNAIKRAQEFAIDVFNSNIQKAVVV